MRDAHPGVRDLQDDPPVLRGDGDLHATAPRRVANRVVDQVAHEERQVTGRARNRGHTVGVQLDRDPGFLRAITESLDLVGRDHVQADVFSPIAPALEAGQVEEVGHDP